MVFTGTFILNDILHFFPLSFLPFLICHSLHGSPLLDAGLVTLNTALSTHPLLVSLDLGDCMLGDEALRLICGMLPPDGAKSGRAMQHCPHFYWRYRTLNLLGRLRDWALETVGQCRGPLLLMCVQGKWKQRVKHRFQYRKYRPDKLQLLQALQSIHKVVINTTQLCHNYLFSSYMQHDIRS